MQSHVFSLVSVGLCVLGQHFLKWGVVSVAYNSSYTVVYILPYTLSISVPFKYNLISQSVGTLPNNINLVLLSLSANAFLSNHFHYGMVQSILG